MVYMDDNGRVVCAEHGGMYLAASIAKNPNKRMHNTPRGTWEAIPADEVAAEGWCCETCKWNPPLDNSHKV